MVVPGLWAGGAEGWTASLIRHTDATRIEWIGVAVWEEGNAHGPTRRLIASNAPVAAGEAAVEAVYAHADVVLIWGVPEGKQRIPARPRHCKVVLTSHGICDYTRRSVAVADAADALVAVSLSAVGPFPRERHGQVRVILNCYEPDRIVPGNRSQLRQSWGVKPGELVVGYIGRVSHEKNPEALLSLVAAHPWVRGVYLSGEDLGPLASLARDRGIADRVVCHGYSSRPGEELAAFDWLLQPSRAEACSIALLEAWAAGVPVICTPVGVTTEHPDCVRLVPLEPTGPALALALARDLADPAGTSARTVRARELAQTIYHPARFGREWTDYLVALVGEPTARAPRAARPIFADLPRSRESILAEANGCPIRSRRGWHAQCPEHRGGEEGHWVVTADECVACLNRGGRSG